MGGGKKKNSDNPPTNTDRSARVIRFRAYLYRIGDQRRRRDGDPMIHTGVHVVTQDGEFFIDRFPEGGAQTREPRTIDVCDIWREPKWPTTINELISAADEGAFDMKTNNCLCATQRMARRMGRLEELLESFENGTCIPEEEKRKLRPYKFN